ncbi:MAG: hypothetical protein ACT4OX_06280 [Actinomycetota bacterium]
MTTREPETSSSLPMEWDAGDATLRTPSGWQRDTTLAASDRTVALVVEASNSPANVVLTTEQLAESLETLEAVANAEMLRRLRDFDQDGAAVSISIPGADGALLLTARFETEIGSYLGPAVGAFLTVKAGNTAYFLSVAAAAGDRDSRELVEEIARSLSIG